ncbi:hypothetical protein [Mycobacteroides abscessus]|uniref:hypothetical protein n=1 Tax=Mycobacteroides abscessus TaxID=36809 RepID=UPI0010422759|nr:hypothetical protein [Mycobacteroides abscessus]
MDDPAAEAKAADDKAKPSGGDSKPQPDADTTKPQPDADTTKPQPDADTTKAEPKRFSPTAGKAMTKMGTPPSAVRAIKAGEPIKGIKGLAKGQWNAGQHYAGKLGTAAAKTVPTAFAKGGIKLAARALPGVGSLYAGYAAFKDFKSGDYIGGMLNVVGMIPGPVGWIGLGLSVGWDALGFGDRYEEWQAPDGQSTFMLMRDAKDVAGVKELDQQITQAQRDVFSYEDGPHGSVWDATPPAALELATPEVVAAATDWINGVTRLFAEIDKTLSGAGEQYITEQRQALVPHFTAMAALTGQVKTLTDQLAAADKGAAAAYKAVTDGNKQARGQLANSGKLEDAGPATTMKTELEKAQSQITAANSKIEQLWTETPPAVVAIRDGAPAGTTPEKKVTETPAKPAAVTPAAVTPAAQTPTKTETPQKSNDDISKLLSQLGNKAQTATPTSNPLGTGSGLGGGSPLGSQGLGGNTGQGTPLSSSKPDTSEKKDEGKKLDDKKLGERKNDDKEKKLDDKSLSTPKPEQAKAAVPAAEAKPGAVPAATVPAPGAAAPTSAQQNAAHAAAAPEQNREVDVKGQKTTFPDVKTAKLASLLAAADPTHPLSLTDAAAQAGLTPPVPGQDPGKQVSPAEAKPGDIMVADGKNFMLLGDGKFYDLTEYKIVSASELPQTMGDRAGYFRLVDPAPGQAAPAADAAAATPAQPQGPVSGQTGGVQHAVPNATGANPLPTDTSQAVQQSGNTSQPAAGTGGVPSVGTPGVPKPGAPGAGPSNAAATNTGTGTSVPSSSPGSLDPGAIK